MKMFLGTTLKSIVAAIMALLMPFVSLIPTTPSVKPTAPSAQNRQVVEDVAETGGTATPEFEELVTEDEIPATTAEADPTAADPADVAEDSATQRDVQSATDRAGANRAYTAEWDISATENDNVHMYYYEDESFFENITASIRSLFTITAYAAEGDEDEEPAEDPVVPAVRDGGKIVIDGTGRTEKYIFLKWLDYDKFIPLYENWTREHGLEDEAYAEYENMDDYIECTIALSISDAHDSMSEGYTNEDLVNRYYPVNVFMVMDDTENFWETYALYRPTSVEIKGEVTEISAGAFLCCQTITSVSIGEKVKKIDPMSFYYTGIVQIIIPANVETIDEYAFAACDNLKKIYVLGAFEILGECAFSMINEDAVIYCITPDAYFNFVDPIAPASDDGDGYHYFECRRVVYNPNALNEMMM